MSSPGFTGAGASEFFAGAGRSTTMNNPNAAATNNNNHHLLHPSHPLYRTQQQLPALFLDPSSQIAPRQTPTPTPPPTTTLIGKRTLAEFQTQQQQQQQQNHLLNHNHVLSNLLLRSVKPRTATFHNSSPMSPMDFSTPELQSPSSYGFQTQRFGMPLLHQLRPNPINTNNNNNNMMGLPITNNNSVLQNPNFPYRSSNLGQAPNRVQVQPPEPEKKKTMDHRLQELEKQLLEDEEEEGGEADAASVITTSEWSETIQNLMGNNGSTQKPASSSPTSSTTSSSSSVASPATGCWKQSLMEAASAISEGKNDAATEILTRLGQLSNPSANSDYRLKDCMVSALKSRINPLENPPPVAELFSKEHAESTQLLFENSLCFKVGFTAANLAILDAAFEEKTKQENNSNRFCIVDFDIGQGKQYMSFLHALSARGRTPPATVRIAAVAESGGEESLRAVGDMLQRQAERFRIRFEFKVVVVTQRLAELTRESLGCNPDEPLAVNFAFKLNRIPDESVSTENPRDELLRRVKALAPHVVTVVEQEMNANTAPFLARVAESCSYYGALFDSVESALGRENSERVKVEEALSRKLCNSVACEGRDRVERCEVFGKWRARMGMAGFQLKPLSQSVAESIKSRLAATCNNNNNRVNSGLTVKEENGGICFGWMGRTLTVASAWR